MSVDEAVAALQGFHGDINYCPGVTCGVLDDTGPGAIEVVAGKTLVVVRPNGDRSRRLAVQDLKVSATFYGTCCAAVYLNDDLFINTNPSDARHLADALVVVEHMPTIREEQAAFERVAKAYRDAAVKPVPGEDVRRYKVQAEAAVREKRFAEAAAAYAKALEIAPWWPEGRFNRALVLAEIGQFAPAVAEMQDYLVLVPDAPNARMAQDRVYEWEAKVPGNSGGALGGMPK